MKEFWTAERTIYPAIFRILLGTLLLIDIFFIQSASDILFNPELNAFLRESRISVLLLENNLYFFLLYGVVLILFILGIGKNITSFLVWLLSLLTLYYFTFALRVWGDKILIYTLLFFVFVDSFRYFSIKPTSGKLSYISTLAIWSILLNLFLVYLNNAYFKIADPDWRKGYAVFYGFAEYPHFKNSFWYPIISNEFISKFINYFVILQQLLFVPMVLWKKTRYLMIAVAIIIHLTMAIGFGLWKFELIIIFLFGFILSDAEWRRIFECTKLKKLINF